MNVSRVHNKLKEGRYAKSVRVEAAVYTAAVLEYVVAEVLEIAGKVAEFYHKKRIFPRCIQITLIGDSELNMLAGNAIIPQGGVMPHIHPPSPMASSWSRQAAKWSSSSSQSIRNQNFRRSRIKSCPRKALPWGAERRGMRLKVKNFE